MMTKTEIKKALYKQKPKARFSHIKNSNVYYNTEITFGEKIKETFVIFFEIPISDMGDAEFLRNEDAKLLIRWII